MEQNWRTCCSSWRRVPIFPQLRAGKNEESEFCREDAKQPVDLWCSMLIFRITEPHAMHLTREPLSFSRGSSQEHGCRLGRVVNRTSETCISSNNRAVNAGGVLVSTWPLGPKGQLKKLVDYNCFSRPNPGFFQHVMFLQT